jgi:predicted dehydrogenase
MPLPIRVGLVGCGNISTIYLRNTARFENLKVVAVADIDAAHARGQATAFNIPTVLTPRELYESADIDVVLNLTIPAAHAEVAFEALRHGKSVYNEKPLAIDRKAGAELVALAREKKLRIGCAPDTFLGSGLQNARSLVDAGAIGTPVAAVAFMLTGGPERWHPNPFFYYQAGGGPMFDMGPYYLTALTTLLGPVRRVTGSARISSPQRTIGSEPHKGRTIEVQVPSHIAAVLDFATGPVATLVTSFDIPGGHTLPKIELYGTRGTMRIPDPNDFDGELRLCEAGSTEWRTIPSKFGYSENSRGVGLADMCAAIAGGRPHRANDRTALHVLDIMHAIHDSSASGTHVELQTDMARPEPFPENLAFGQVPP